MFTEPWFAYPPEMNAARIIGPGPMPWYVAAGVWAVQAVQAAEAQAIFAAQNAVQVTNIAGATSTAIADSIGPFAAWLASMQAAAARAALENKAVGDAHVAAMSTMIPLPVIIANRVAAATAHAANAVGAINPASLVLEAQYAGFQVQNSGVMTGYDGTVRTATVPRSFAPPPPLTSGAEAFGTADAITDAIARDVTTNYEAIAQHAQQTINDPAMVQQLQSQAGMMPQQYASQAMPMSSQMMSSAQTAFAPAQSMMGQMSTPVGGVRANGLGSGSGAMSSLGGGGGAGGLSLGGFGGGGVGAGGVALAGAPLAGAPASPGGAPMARPFTGIPLSEAAANAGARGPLGGVPAGAAGAGRGGQGETKSRAQLTAEEAVFVDPVAEVEKRREQARMFA